MNRENLKKAVTFILVAVVICGCFAYVIPQCKEVKDVFKLLLNWFTVGVCLDCCRIFLMIIKAALDETISSIKNDDDNNEQSN